MSTEKIAKSYTIEEVARMAAERHISYGKLVPILEQERAAADKPAEETPDSKSSPHFKTRRVKLLDIEGNVIEKYASIKEAAWDMDVSVTVVAKDCKGMNKNPFAHRDFRFCYDED